MNTYHFVLNIILIELVLLTILLMVAYFRGKVIKNIQKWREKQKQTFYAKVMQHNPVFPLFFSMRALLLEVIEERKEELNEKEVEKVLTHCLILYADKWKKSLFFKKRLFAVRSFVVLPHLKYEEPLLYLLDDKHFLIAGIAARGLILIESISGILKILDKMKHNPGYTYYYYKDLLLKGSRQVFSILYEEILKKNPHTYLICLDIFSFVALPIPVPLLKADLTTDNEQIRLSVLKILRMNPPVDMEEIVLRMLFDKNQEIRMEAIASAEPFGSESVMIALQTIFKEDPSIKIKIAAAQGLKKMGDRGGLFLKEQKEKTFQEIGQYVMEFEY